LTDRTDLEQTLHDLLAATLALPEDARLALTERAYNEESVGEEPAAFDAALNRFLRSPSLESLQWAHLAAADMVPEELAIFLDVYGRYAESDEGIGPWARAVVMFLSATGRAKSNVARAVSVARSPVKVVGVELPGGTPEAAP
jgi:hypothetical protein